MGARLGHVLYWVGCAFALLFVGDAALIAYGIDYNGPDASVGYLFAGITGAAGVCAWLIGRAARYVLAGG
jgi:hypothetical protein